MTREVAKKAINQNGSFTLEEKRTLRQIVDNSATSPATDIADASTAHALNGTFDDAEVEAALDALGTKINAILDVINGA